MPDNMPTITLTVPPEAIAYAVNRLKVNLELLPEKRDPELLFAQLLSDIGIAVEPVVN